MEATTRQTALAAMPGKIRSDRHAKQQSALSPISYDAEPPVLSDSIAYVYDGTPEGLLTAIFNAYANHEDPTDFCTAERLQLRIGQDCREIATDFDLALRVRRGLSRTCGEDTARMVHAAALSDAPETGTAIYRFIRYAMKAERPGYHCMDDIVHPAVAPVAKLQRAVINERHHWVEFLRFSEMEGGVWYAQCNPNAAVVPLLMDWFAQRFNTQPFLIYDEIHHMAGIYHEQGWDLVSTDALQLPQESSTEALMAHAWRTFYDTVAIESRYNPELRRQLMPKRFWKNMTEMKESIPDGSLAKR